MPPASPVTVRIDPTQVNRAALAGRVEELAGAEAGRWRVFGQVTGQHVAGDTITTTVQPRGRGSALAIRRAIEVSGHHALVEGATP